MLKKIVESATTRFQNIKIMWRSEILKTVSQQKFDAALPFPDFYKGFLIYASILVS